MLSGEKATREGVWGRKIRVNMVPFGHAFLLIFVCLFGGMCYFHFIFMAYEKVYATAGEAFTVVSTSFGFAPDSGYFNHAITDLHTCASPSYFALKKVMNIIVTTETLQRVQLIHRFRLSVSLA